MTLSPKQPYGWGIPLALPAKVERVFDLAHGLAPGMPHHPNHPPFGFVLTKTHGEVVYPGDVSASSELIVTGGHVGTHVDALCHISRGGLVFGGVQVASHQSHSGGISLHPVHELQPIIGPGHLLDLPRILGRHAHPSDEVGAAQLETWFANRTMPGPGSVVLIRTGWSRYWGDNRKFLGLDTGCPGAVISAARWLADRDVLATGADTIAYERTPDPELPVHVHLLMERGIPIMEALDLEALAEQERHRLPNTTHRAGLTCGCTTQLIGAFDTKPLSIESA
jgi:kynurenine formamidase